MAKNENSLPNDINIARTVKDLNRVQDVKTVLSLPESIHNLIAELASNKKGWTKKKLLNLVAAYGQKLLDENRLEINEMTESPVRKSYSMDGETRELLEKISKHLNISRDQAFYTAFQALVEDYAKKEPSREELLKYGEQIKNALEKMSEIWEDPQLEEAKKAWDDIMIETGEIPNTFEFLDHCLYGGNTFFDAYEELLKESDEENK